MASPDVLDLPTLVAPLAGDSPVGKDLRTDASPTSPYWAVRDARTAASGLERQAVTAEKKDEVPPPDWKPVLRDGQKILRERSKDLEIVAYMIEALVRLHGFAGLRDGFRLTRELVTQFWDGIYPVPDEDGVATRVAPLTGLNGEDAEGTLVGPIARVPLTEGSSCGPYAFYRYQQALTVSQLGDETEREKRVTGGAVSMVMFEKAVTETPAAFFTNLVEDITACQSEFASLGQVLAEKCGDKAPPTSNIRSALEACLDAVRHVARHKLAGAAQTEAETTTAGAAGAPAAVAGPAGALRNREDAFRTLLSIADFFRRTEPHSPVSYSLDQAVRWGRMALPELLAELIADETVRQGCFKQVGIRPPESP